MTVTANAAEVAWQLVDVQSVTVYVMFVVPAESVVTTPELSTVATLGFEEFQIYVNVGAPVA